MRRRSIGCVGKTGESPADTVVISAVGDDITVPLEEDDRFRIDCGAMLALCLIPEIPSGSNSDYSNTIQKFNSQLSVWMTLYFEYTDLP